MAKFAAFRRMVERFVDVADFVVVYTLEAHAIGDWPYPVNKFEVKFHRTLSERFIAAAHLYDQGVPCALLVDDMDDNACLSYATEPERLYVIRDGMVALQGGQGPFMYRIEEVERWLQEFSETRKQEKM